MQYFQAVNIGKQRSGKSQMLLFNIAGFAMLTLTTKKKDGKFFPIGEEDYATIIKTNDGYVTILVDEEGYTKAQSKAMEKDDAIAIFKKVKESGISEYMGNEIKIWSETYPTVKNEINLE